MNSIVGYSFVDPGTTYVIVHETKKSYLCENGYGDETLLDKWYVNLDFISEEEDEYTPVSADISYEDTVYESADAYVSGLAITFEIISFEYEETGLPLVRFYGPKIELERLMDRYDDGSLELRKEDVDFGLARDLLED